MSTESWLVRTRQAWKLKVFFALLLLMAASLCVLTTAVSATSPSADLVVWSGLGAAASTLASIVWFWLSVVCPACNARVAGRILRTAVSSAWLIEVMTMTRCPVCGARTLKVERESSF